jgi:hypothetical protein
MTLSEAIDVMHDDCLDEDSRDRASRLVVGILLSRGAISRPTAFEHRGRVYWTTHGGLSSLPADSSIHWGEAPPDPTRMAYGRSAN